MINVQIIGIAGQIKQVFEKNEVNLSFFDDEVQALNATEKNQPSVIFLDYDLRQLGTHSYIKLLLRASRESKIIVVADELSDDGILNCLTAGARGYQNKNKLNEYILKMIRVVDAGEAWITRSMVVILLDTLVLR